MDYSQSIATMSSNIKSASFINILPFLFLYILKTHEKKEDINCDSDKLYKYIPNKSNTFHPNLKYFLLSIPIILLLVKSNTSTSLEHTLVILSYAIAIKTSMHYLTPCLAKQEFTNIIFIVLLLNLRYFNIIQEYQHCLIASGMFSAFLLSSREITSANMISDYTIAVLSFILPKYLS